MVLSVSMAAFGVILGSTVVLIGSMLIAPLLYPLLSLALGIITGDDKLIGRSLLTLVKSIILAVLAAAVIGFLFSPHDAAVFVSVASAPSLAYAVIAAIAGFAGAFAVTKPYLNATLPGVAIAVSLVPPLAVAGVAFSLLDWPVLSDALLLFLTNVIGILFSSMIVFSLMRFAVKKKVTEEAVKEEEKAIKQETKTA
jgi:uncharacterized hydrophobic protein (TIGR00271 family)